MLVKLPQSLNASSPIDVSPVVSLKSRFILLLLLFCSAVFIDDIVSLVNVPVTNILYGPPAARPAIVCGTSSAVTT